MTKLKDGTTSLFEVVQKKALIIFNANYNCTIAKLAYKTAKNKKYLLSTIALISKPNFCLLF